MLSDEGERRVLEAREAFVITPSWPRTGGRSSRKGVRRDRVDARQDFGFYHSIVLLDFSLDPMDGPNLEFFEYTQKPVEILHATLDRFREQLAALAKLETEG